MARCTRVGIPEAAREPCSRGEIALCELDRLREAGVRSAPSWPMPLRQQRRRPRPGERGLRVAGGSRRSQEVYPADVALVPSFGRA